MLTAERTDDEAASTEETGDAPVHQHDVIVNQHSVTGHFKYIKLMRRIPNSVSIWIIRMITF